MKRFKVVLGLFMSILTIFCCAITSYASPNISVLRNGKGWLDLSYQDKCDTVDAFIQKVAKEYGVPHVDVSCYQWPGGAAAAYNNMPWYNQICVNMSTFEDDLDATLAGETVEYHVVKILAHEVRHSYQAIHMNDDTEYGKACRAGQDSYISFEGDRVAYYAQFIEQDADTFGIEYANKYVKNGKLAQTKFVANNGKLFDSVFYANKYPDVKNALGTDGKTLLNHYNTFGISEGRMANANDTKE